MKVVLTFLLLLLSGGSSIPMHALTNGSNNAAYPVSSKTKLQLTTSIIEYLSCHPSGLTLRLLLTFRNIGTEKIILDKRSSIVGRHFVSRNLKALAAGNYEETGRAEFDSGPYIPDAPDVPKDMSDFIILAPGEVYEAQSGWTRVHFTVNDGTPHTEDGLGYGSHFLQVEIGTWPYASESVVKRARKQWRDRGYLWTEPLISSPIQFTIERNRQISKCS